MEACFGIEIQKVILTKKYFYEGLGDYIYMYQHCALKICNEAVVEGMCSVVSKHADGAMSLTFTHLAMESMIDYNKPVAANGDKLLTEALNLLFSQKNYAHGGGWRFFRTDSNKHRLVSTVVSPMIDRIKKEESSLHIME